MFDFHLFLKINTNDELDISVGRLLISDNEMARQQVDKIEHYIKNGSSLYSTANTNCSSNNGSSTFGLPDLRDRTLLGKGSNNSTLGTETGSAAASSVITNATSNTGTGTTGSTTAGRTNTTGTFATSAKDSATGSALTDNVNAAHTHTVPALSIPALTTTLPSSVVNFIIKI